MHAGMCNVGVVLGGWPGFISIRTSSGRGQRKGCWLGTVEDPWDISKCHSTATPAQALWGKQKGKHASVPRWRRLEHGYGEVTQRERRTGGRGGERRMQMCGAAERRGTLGGSTTSYCLESGDRSKPTGQTAEVYSPEYTYTHKHETDWQDSGIVYRS